MTSSRTEEGALQAIALIELAKRRWVESLELGDRAWPVLVHQLAIGVVVSGSQWALGQSNSGRLL